MAKQRIEGPYRVQSNETQWEIIELVDGKPEPLRPRITYEKDKRTSAYRRLASLNRKWQKSNRQEVAK